MALLFMDGFGHYGTSHLTQKWTIADTSGVNTQVTSGIGNGGGNGFSMSVALIEGNNNLSRAIPARESLIAGFAVRFHGAIAGTTPLFPFARFRSSSVTQLSLRANTDRTISVMRGNSSGTVLGTSEYVFDTEYHYVEFKATFHGSTGSYTLRVDGQTIQSGSNVNTQNVSGVTTADEFIFSNLKAGSGYYVDDVYICDTLGATNNDFLGEVKVRVVRPTADGHYTQWAPSSGSDRFSLVNGINPDGDATYVSAETPGNKVSFQMDSLPPETGTILGVQALGSVRKIEAGPRTTRPFVRVGGSDHNGSAQPVGLDYFYRRQVWDRHPGSNSPWTRESLASAEFGWEVL